MLLQSAVFQCLVKVKVAVDRDTLIRDKRGERNGGVERESGGVCKRATLELRSASRRYNHTHAVETPWPQDR